RFLWPCAAMRRTVLTVHKPAFRVRRRMNGPWPMRFSSFIARRRKNAMRWGNAAGSSISARCHSMSAAAEWRRSLHAFFALDSSEARLHESSAPFDVELWRPSSLKPKELPLIPFAVWTLFHAFHIFKNRDYALLLMRDSG